GKVALAAALIEIGDRKGAAAQIRDAYRNDDLAKDVETAILTTYRGLLTDADLRFRADRLVYDMDYAEAAKAAARAGPSSVAIAKARQAVEKKAKNAGALLAAVPAGARSDPSYLYARISFLRKAESPEKAEEAASLLMKAPRDPQLLVR